MSERPKPDEAALLAASEEARKIAAGEKSMDLREHSFPFVLERIADLERRLAQLEQP